MSLRTRLLCFGAFTLCCNSSARAAGDQAVEGEVILTFKSTVREETANTVLRRHSLGMTKRFERLSRHRKRVFGMVRDSGRSTAAMIAELEKDPDVETAEPNYLRHVSAVALPGDPDFSQLWGLNNSGQTVGSTRGVSGVDIKFPAAWRLSRQASEDREVVVAVVDTGLDITHPDLAANVWTNPKEIAGNGVDDDGDGYTDDVHGYDFAENSGSMSDSGYHGTHVAGTIAALGGNGLGIIGVQPHAKILPLKVSDDGDSMSTSAVLSAMNYVVTLKERGVNIVAVNASYGGGSSSRAEQSAVEALRDAGIILVAAAGNDGTSNDRTPMYPASYTTSNIISVAAVDQSGALASFSNYGAASVDIAAPGVNIYSASPATGTLTSTVQAAGSTYSAAAIEYSGETDASGLSGLVYNCGLGNTTEFPAGVRGNIALIQRGTLTFSGKISNAANAGAIAAIVYDNTSASVGSGGSWTLGASGNWIPAVQVTQATGTAILARLGGAVTATVSNYPAKNGGYRFLDGTSMATPHVTGAVAFAALNFPDDTVEDRRNRILAHPAVLSSLSGKVSSGGMLNLLTIVDGDSDGLPDWWEKTYPGSMSEGATGDSDRDGFTNLQEYLSGTDPSVAGSHPDFNGYSAGTESGAGDFVLKFFGATGITYQVEWSDSLESGDWHVLGSSIAGNGEDVEVSDPGVLVSSLRRFYRLRLISQ